MKCLMLNLAKYCACLEWIRTAFQTW